MKRLNLTQAELRKSAEQIKRDLGWLGKSQRYLSKIFKRSPSQIHCAIWTNDMPTLRAKILNHIEILKSKEAK